MGEVLRVDFDGEYLKVPNCPVCLERMEPAGEGSDLRWACPNRPAGFHLPATWDRSGLEAVGFTGFVTLFGLNPTAVSPAPGIYSVLRPSTDPPTFLEISPLRAKVGRAPMAYPIADLTSRWNEASPIVYIGKAEPKTGLAGRLGPYAKKSSSHSGGRSIWQLSDAHELLIAWIETPDARAVERAYIEAFKERFGKRPFANRRA